MARLSLCLLGLFQATLGEEPITGFKSDKVRALLAYLAVEANRPHRRETLAGLLWPEWSDREALSNLRSNLSNLRLAIGDRDAIPPFLLISGDTIQFNTASDHWLDVTDFGVRSADSGLLSAASRIENLESAIGLYRGSFLEGFSVSDAAPFEEWALLKKEQLGRQMLEALHRLAAIHEQCGEYEQALPHARRQVELEPWNEEAHQQLMRLLALSGQRSAALAQYQACRRLLSEELGVEPARETTALYESIHDGTLLPVASQHAVPWEEPPAPGEPPFIGLRHFDEGDAGLFFGREQLTASLVARLREDRFLAVLGASGSGKSSIVRAGLVPALRRGERMADGTPPPDGSACWLVRIFTPTAHPLEALAASLTHEVESVTATATLMDDLARDPRSLDLYLKRAMHLGGASHVLLVVDQFEELFSLCRNQAERKAFVDNLLTAAASLSLDGRGPSCVGPAQRVGGEGAFLSPQPSSRWGEGASPATVVIALRADFYAQCAPFDNLRQVLAQRQAYIGPMTAEELRRAIEQPARSGEWGFEPGLVDLILRDVGDEPGSLPLLSHALLETWRRRHGRTLTLEGYTGAGGVRGAIAQTAETVFAGLQAEQQEVARSILLRLTELGEGSPAGDTRRRVALSELTHSARPEDAPAVEGVLKTLADARLITISEETVEVAHEALIREWPMLREWLNENRDSLRLHRQITEAARDWDRLDRDPGALYRGLRLAQALEWAEIHVADLNPLERTFLNASQVFAEQRAAEHEAQRQRELEAAQTLAEAERQRAEGQAYAARRLRRRAVYLIAALIVALALGLAAAGLGWQASQKARLATSREYASTALLNVDVDPELSTWLALHAVGVADTVEAENALHRAVQAIRTRLTLSGHAGDVLGVAYSPDGRRLATASLDNTAKLWDLATGRPLFSLTGHTDWVYDIAYSPDGQRLATASKDGTAKVWDANTGQEVLTLSGHTAPIVAVAFSPDGARLATAGYDDLLKVWDAGTGTELLSLPHALILDVAFSPDGKHLAAAGDDGIVKLWEISPPTSTGGTTGQEVFTLTANAVSAWSLAFSPDGDRLAVGGGDGLTKVWDVSTGLRPDGPLLTLAGSHRLAVSGVAFTPDVAYLVTGSMDGTAKVWDALSGLELFALAGHGGAINQVAVSPDGTRVATGSRDRTAKVWDITPTGSRDLLTYVFARAAPVTAGSTSPDRTRLVTVSEDGMVEMQDALTGQEMLTVVLPAYTGWIGNVALSPDNTCVATTLGITATVWTLTTGQEVATMRGHTDAINSLAFSPDGSRLATASDDGTAKVWDASTGQELFTLSGHTAPVLGVAFSPDGERLATASMDMTARVWDANTGERLLTLTGHSDYVRDVVFSPDGTRLGTSSLDGTARVWDASLGRELLTLSGHTATVLRSAFSPDGKWLATASGDGTAKVWDTRTGQELLTLTGHSGQVLGVAFSPDGTRLLTAGTDWTNRVYALRIEDLVAAARSRLTRTFSEEECRQYLNARACPPGP